MGHKEEKKKLTKPQLRSYERYVAHGSHGIKLAGVYNYEAPATL